jgi:hypothetical protein
MWRSGGAAFVAAALFVSCGTLQGVEGAGSADGDAGDDAARLDGGSSEATTTYASIVAADHPLLYLHLDEAAGATTAAAAAGPAGSIFGPVTLGEPGAVGTAFGFDGMDSSGERIEVDAQGFDFVANAPFTLEAWVRVDESDSDYRHIFVKDTDAEPREEYGLLTHAGDITFERFVMGTSAYVAKPLPPGNAWRHVVGTYDGTTLRLFIDGAVVASTPDVRAAGPKTRPLRIGAKTDTEGVLQAAVDEVAVYGGALDASRIAAHYRAVIGQPAIGDP